MSYSQSELFYPVEFLFTPLEQAVGRGSDFSSGNDPLAHLERLIESKGVDENQPEPWENCEDPDCWYGSENQMHEEIHELRDRIMQLVEKLAEKEALIIKLNK